MYETAGFFDWGAGSAWTFGLFLGLIWYLLGGPQLYFRQIKIRRLLKNKNADKRIEGAGAAREYPALLKELEALLTDQNYEVRRIAAYSIEKLDPERRLDRIRIELEHPDPEIRSMAQEELDSIEKTETTDSNQKNTE